MQRIDPRELNALAEFATRGGIGTGLSLTDCVAESPDQLMYISGDELILLRDLDDYYIASCEGVVGWVKKDHVGLVKLASGSQSLSDLHEGDEILSGTEQTPKAVLTAPSPPSSGGTTPLPHSDSLDHIVSPPNFSPNDLEPISSSVKPKRISGPFELDSPQQSPGIVTAEGYFASLQGDKQEVVEDGKDSTEDEEKRESILSNGSSEAFGGIAGFMMGGVGSEDEHTKDVQVTGALGSPPTPSIITPLNESSSPLSNTQPLPPPSPSLTDDEVLDEDWDIYGDYARESMYGPASRLSLAQRRQSRLSKVASPSKLSFRDRDSFDGGLNAARAALEGRRKEDTPSSPSAKADDENTNPETPKAVGRKDPITPIAMPSSDSTTPGRSVATELRLRIQRARQIAEDADGPVTPLVPPPPISIPSPPRVVARVSPKHEAFRITDEDDGDDDADRVAGGNEKETTLRGITPSVSSNGLSESSSRSPDIPTESEESTIIETPLAQSQPQSMTFTAPSPEDKTFALPEQEGILLASPLSIDDKFAPTQSPDLPQPTTPSLVPPPPPNYSPHLSPNLNASQGSWTTSPRSTSPSPTPSLSIPAGTPSSPHSISATKQAVDAARSTPDGQRTRGLTLVGRMDLDLSASKGPVPITFLIGGPGLPGVQPKPPRSVSGPSVESKNIIGLGLPVGNGMNGMRRATSPLSPTSFPDIAVESRFPTPPMPIRTATSPIPTSTPVSIEAPPPMTTPLSSSVPKSKYFPPTTSAEPSALTPAPPSRPRARSFSAAFSRSSSKTRKGSAPDLRINTDTAPPPLPARTPPTTAPVNDIPKKRSIFGKKESTAPSIAALPPRSPTSLNMGTATASSSSVHLPTSTTPTNESNLTLSPVSYNSPVPSSNQPPSARSASFSFKSSHSSTSTTTTTKIPRKNLTLPSPVSHKDFEEETIKADGMDFELIQPKRPSFSPSSPSDSGGGLSPRDADRYTMKSERSSTSLKALPETDEWGFLKETSPTPEIFMSRNAGADHRAAEQKWLSIISTPLGSSAPSKKIRKLAVEAGIPSSLRGKVWAWFMSSSMSARVPGLYQQLLAHDKGKWGEAIDRDVSRTYSDHSIFSTPNSPGQSDLRSLLRAYSNFAPTGYIPPMSLIAGALLIHCVVEDAFWLLNGLVNGVLKDYWGGERWRLERDAKVFEGVLGGSEPKLSKLFKDLGIDAIDFLERWYTTLYIRCLPWPTMLRVMDALVSEGPRYLLVTSLTILTLSRDRLLSLPRNKTEILNYLQDLPQDSLLLPENFMKSCENVKFRDEDLRKMRAAVEKEMNSGLRIGNGGRV